MTNQTKGAAEHTGNNAARIAKQKKSKQRRRIVVFSIEIIILAAMLGVLYFVWDKSEDGPTIVELPTEATELEVAPEVQENPVMKGYWNIALFGIDATKESEMIKGGRSDSIIIASINLDTGDIKLMSVYRDTYLNIGDDYYIKCNTAYYRGGGEQAVSTLNGNLDLDINDFVAIGYEGLKGIIDGLDGIYLDVDEEEMLHINNYQYSINEVLNCGYEEVTETGYQHLDGMQATAYCRIRYRRGFDFARAAAQREVLKAIEEKIKQTNLVTLTEVATEAMKHVVTTLTTKDVLPYLAEVANYRIVDESGFPEETMRATAKIGSKGSSVVPLDLEKNVVWLHEFLFDEKDYQVSDKVKSYSAQIKADTEQYLENQ